MSASDEELRQCVAIVKRHFLAWRVPPVELPAESVIYDALREVREVLRSAPNER